MDTSTPRNIGSRLEFFVDEWLIDDMNGVALTMHRPVPREVVMEFDRPWEGPVSLPGIVMDDDGLFKSWYGARSSRGASGQSQDSHTAYAESQDGIRWERPMLGLAEIDGSSENNVIRFVDTDDTHTWEACMEALIRPGLDSNNWTDRNVMMAKGLLETVPGELSVYYGEHFKLPTCRAHRATYRTDGFVSVQAGYGGGELVTRTLTFTGDELVMNFSTSAVGSVRAEIQAPAGRPIEGYELHRSSEIFGDAIEQVVS